MRYRLSTLLIVLAVGPFLLGWMWAHRVEIRLALPLIGLILFPLVLAAVVLFCARSRN